MGLQHLLRQQVPDFNIFLSKKNIPQTPLEVLSFTLYCCHFDFDNSTKWERFSLLSLSITHLVLYTFIRSPLILFHLNNRAQPLPSLPIIKVLQTKQHLGESPLHSLQQPHPSYIHQVWSNSVLYTSDKMSKLLCPLLRPLKTHMLSSPFYQPVLPLSGNMDLNSKVPSLISM